MEEGLRGGAEREKRKILARPPLARWTSTPEELSNSACSDIEGL